MTSGDSLDRILAQLGELRARSPELRFGQLIAIIGALAEDETGHPLWDVEDADFAAALESLARDMARRDSEPDDSAPVTDDGGVESHSSSGRRE